MSGPDAALTRARAAREHGKPKRALVEAWKATDHAVRRDEEAGLEAARQVAADVRDHTTGRVQREAEILVAYCSHSIDASRAGERPSTLMERLFSRKKHGAQKVCPDCAETIKAAARLCRFCGYRFDRGLIR